MTLTYKRLFSSLRGELGIRSPGDHLVARFFGPFVFPLVAIVVTSDVVPALTVTACESGEEHQRRKPTCHSVRERSALRCGHTTKEDLVADILGSVRLQV